MTKQSPPAPANLSTKQAMPIFGVTSWDGIKRYAVAPYAKKMPNGWRWNEAACRALMDPSRTDDDALPAPADSKGQISAPDGLEDILVLIERMKDEVADTFWDRYVDCDFEPEKVVGERKRIIDHLTKVHRAKFL